MAYRRPSSLSPEPENSNGSIYKFRAYFGYAGYEHYFRAGTHSSLESFAAVGNKVKAFEHYIQRNHELFNLSEVEEQETFRLNTNELAADTQFTDEWPTFSNDLKHDADRTIAALSLAMHQVVHTTLNADAADNATPKLHCRLDILEPTMYIKHLRAHHCGQLVSVQGTVSKSSDPFIKCLQLEFKCAYCGGTQVHPLEDNIHTVPTGCPTYGCNARNHLKALYDAANTIDIPAQSVTLVELIGMLDDDSTSMAKNLECELCDDLVRSCKPGDDVIFTGVLGTRNVEHGSAGAAVHEYFLRVQSVHNAKQRLYAFSSASVEFIQAVRTEADIFRTLVHSLAPHIYGHELVKAGLLLALFGGTRAKKTERRSNSHVLIVGDPGLGKSQLLRACAQAAPRGLYVGGNTSSGAGLTAAMVKEPSGDYRLEAGAFMLADEGCCCIDEFDKMTADKATLLETMEQQTVSIAKAGIAISLPARLCVLAAANPFGGRYDRAKTVSENIQLPSALLSRFDLVYIISDESRIPDNVVSAHILSRMVGNQSLLSVPSTQPSHDVNTLHRRLLLQPNDKVNHLPTILLKKYIAYAKANVHPVLADDAIEAIKTYYLKLRKEHKHADAIPITPRQLESAMRLTQARARLELRSIATADDVADVVDIMQHCLWGVLTNELGALDTTRTQSGIGMSKQKTAARFVNALKIQAEHQKKNVFKRAELQTIASQLGIQGMAFNNLLDSLNLEGYLLMMANNSYKLITIE